MVVTTDSGRGAGADPAGDSAGAAVELSPVGDADLSTAAVVVTAGLVLAALGLSGLLALVLRRQARREPERPATCPP